MTGSTASACLVAARSTHHPPPLTSDAAVTRLQRQSRLADAARADQGDETTIAEVRSQVGQQLVTSDDARHGGRQPSGPGPCRQQGVWLVIVVEQELEARALYRVRCRARSPGCDAPDRRCAAPGPDGRLRATPSSPRPTSARATALVRQPFSLSHNGGARRARARQRTAPLRRDGTARPTGHVRSRLAPTRRSPRRVCLATTTVHRSQRANASASLVEVAASTAASKASTSTVTPDRGDSRRSPCDDRGTGALADASPGACRECFDEPWTREQEASVPSPRSAPPMHAHHQGSQQATLDRAEADIP